MRQLRDDSRGCRKSLTNGWNICLNASQSGGVTMMNVMITMDERTRDAMQAMPRKMSASRVLRHLMRAFQFDDAEWSVYAKTDECKELKMFIKPYKRRLGLE